jgi:hypothetical protein
MRPLLAGVLAPPLFSGPPFLTDDPEPVALDRMGLYLFTDTTWRAHGRTGFGPAMEFNDA